MKQKIAVLLLLCLAALPGCGTNQTAVPMQTEASETTLATVTEETKPERLKVTDFGNLPKVAEQVGFSFRATEKLTGGWRFEKITISQTEDTDEYGNTIGTEHKSVKLNYLWTNNVFGMSVLIYPIEGQPVQPPTYVYTKELGGVEVLFGEYILHIVEPDYEMTEEDWAFYNAGKGGFSTNGEDTRYDSYYRQAFWVEDGVFYFLRAGEDAAFDDVEQMVQEILNADLQ